MLLLSGFRTGFYLNYTGLRLPLQPKNMKSADVHNSELLAIINEERHFWSHGRTFQLFTNIQS